jgi:hypothetical protein
MVLVMLVSNLSHRTNAIYTAIDVASKCLWILCKCGGDTQAMGTNDEPQESRCLGQSEVHSKGPL